MKGKPQLRIKKNCLTCGKEMILLITSDHKFCSFECYRKSRIGKKPGNYGKHYLIKSRIRKNCIKCGKVFGVIPSKKGKIYCSPKCFQDSRLTLEEKKERKKLADLGWNKSDRHKQACMRWCKNHPERVRIASKVAWALKNGKIEIEPCEICGSGDNLQKHHPDYTKPLEIKWLCRNCHTELHRHIKKHL